MALFLHHALQLSTNLFSLQLTEEFSPLIYSVIFKTMKKMIATKPSYLTSEQRLFLVVNTVKMYQITTRLTLLCCWWVSVWRRHRLRPTKHVATLVVQSIQLSARTKNKDHWSLMDSSDLKSITLLNHQSSQEITSCLTTWRMQTPWDTRPEEDDSGDI